MMAPTPVRLVLAALALLLLVPQDDASAASRARHKAPKDPSAWASQATAELLGQALSSSRGWDLLKELCDRIGARLSGSPELDEAVSWAAERMSKGDGVAVSLQEVQVPHWVRGQESLELLSGRTRFLPMLGLGMSVGTKPEGVEGEVLVVTSFDELNSLGAEQVSGRIVLFDVPFTTYGETVKYRLGGPSAAAALGAAAVLVRSVTPVSLNTPHTGTTRYQDDAPKIPAAAITVEDATHLHRLQDDGVVSRVRLRMAAEHRGDVLSSNVIAELRGREIPDEVVLVSCHLDSWDVGQGAQDDGAGCVMAMEAIRLISELDYRPRRTLRAVLFTNEENGAGGGAEYAARNQQDHVVAIEADVGCGPARGWRLDLGQSRSESVEGEEAAQAKAEELMAPIRTALEVLGAGGLRLGYGGTDIKPLVAEGTLGLGLDMDTTGYWPIHHTEADTLDKIDPLVLRRNTAVMAITAFLLAESQEPMVR